MHTDGHAQRDSATQFVLPANLNLRAAQQLKQDLLLLLEETGPVSVDAQAVNRLSTAAVQVLTAFVLELEQRRRQVEFARPSETFRNGFDTLGLSHIIMRAQVSP